ncbi:MAG: insulinase family protein [Candidatus Omnitrophica bacterium]|nr:insulinase family protein [Candidatus Omnitrophota bacterium]
MTSTETPSKLVGETRIGQPSEGVTLLHRQTDANEIVAVEMVLPMGGREESVAEAGIGTLALRMLTRGTQTMSDYEIAVGFESLGASFSTDIQKDRAVLSVQTTLEHFDATMRLVEEILLRATFPKEFFEIEKEILRKEIIEDLDSPFYAALRLFQSTLFGSHPYAKPNCGTVESVASLSRDATREFFEDRFPRGPVSIGVVGNLQTQRIEEAMAGVFEHLGKRPSPSVETVDLSTMTRPSRPMSYEKRSIDSECMVYGFTVPGLHDPAYASLKVIDSIMGGSMDSRLFSEVREKQGLVYQIGSSFPGLEWGSFFAISLMTTAQNHDQVLETLGREIEKIRLDPPEEDEIDRAKTFLRGTYLMSQEKNSDQALLLARYHSLGLGIDFVDRYPKMIEAVKAESMVEIAREYFREPALAIVGPGQEIE